MRDITRINDQLIRMQRPDGSWAQLPSRESDAYATGQALVALNQAGRLSPAHPAFKRGIAFLVATQKADGSWLVKTRRTWRRGVPYFESGFPHGKNQFISYAATAWATMALALSNRDEVSNALMGDPRKASSRQATDAKAGNEELTPLIYAAGAKDRGNTEVIKALLAAGADVHARTPEGDTALTLAERYGKTQTAAVLRKAALAGRPDGKAQ